MNVPHGVEFFQNIQHVQAYGHDGLQGEATFVLWVHILKVGIKFCYHHVIHALLFEVTMSEESRETYIK